jgi:copper chaperone CopZ
MMLSGAASACDCAAVASRPAVELHLTGDESVVGDSEIALQVGGITCASCTQIVHMALSGVAGVQAIELRATQDPTVLIAVVSCDDSVGAEDLATVTNDLGYPTTIVEDES